MGKWIVTPLFGTLCWHTLDIYTLAMHSTKCTYRTDHAFPDHIHHFAGESLFPFRARIGIDNGRVFKLGVKIFF